jgi:hypothetical protein
MNLAWTLQGQIYMCYQIAVDFYRYLLIALLNMHVFRDIVLCRLANSYGVSEDISVSKFAVVSLLNCNHLCFDAVCGPAGYW